MNEDMYECYEELIKFLREQMNDCNLVGEAAEAAEDFIKNWAAGLVTIGLI